MQLGYTRVSQGEEQDKPRQHMFYTSGHLTGLDF